MLSLALSSAAHLEIQNGLTATIFVGNTNLINLSPLLYLLCCFHSIVPFIDCGLLPCLMYNTKEMIRALYMKKTSQRYINF